MRQGMPSGLASGAHSLPPLPLLPSSLPAFRMSARSFKLPGALSPSARRSALWPAVALCLVTAAGCQSMFHDNVTAARGQSPAGLGGGIPKPPAPPKPRQPGEPSDDDDTIIEQISGTVGGYFKPAADSD